MNAVIQTNIDAFNSTLGRYMVFTSKLPQEAMEAKGRDLSVKLYQAFAEKKWGGPGKKMQGLARRELDQRTAQGRGTKVRPSLLAEYQSKRGFIMHDRRYAKWSGNQKAHLRTIREAVGLWQSIVGREIGARQRGVGVLAASFLWYRSRSSQSRGTYYVKNRTGRTLGFAEIQEGSMRIVSEREGVDAVDQRYSIVAQAVETARQDMVTYLRERHQKAYMQLFNELPL